MFTVINQLLSVHCNVPSYWTHQKLNHIENIPYSMLQNFLLLEIQIWDWLGMFLDRSSCLKSLDTPETTFAWYENAT